jgi:hypothetical protein
MANTEYYYKRIEGAIAGLKSISAKLKELLDGTGLESVFSDMSKDAEGLDRKCESVWLNCLEDYKTSHKLESLDDSQKEAAALQNKEAFDVLITKLSENSAEMQPLLTAMKAYKDVHIEFLKLFSEYDSFMKQYVDDSWDSEDESQTQLVLTPLELYYALTFLNEPTVRVIFAHVSPGVLEDLLKAYQANDKDVFCHLIKAHEVYPSNQLLDYLVTGTRELSLSGIMSLFPSDPSERIKLLDAMNDDPVGDIFMEDLLNGGSSTVEDLTAPEISHMFGECVVRSVGEFCVNTKIPLRFRKKFMALYNQARITFSDIPDLSELTPCESENEIGMRIIEKLRINYIMKKIHEAMEADDDNRFREGETPNKIPSDSRSLSFPTRLDKEITQPQLYIHEKIAVLTEIYNVFGGQFEDMTSADFVYLFGASNKVPSTYNPPYYWCGDESTLKAILKVLYVRQPRLLKQLILHVSDKEKGATGHDWGKNKDKVAYRDVERIIIDIIHRLTGKALKEL